MAQWRSVWGDAGELGSHQGYISNPRKCAQAAGLIIGSAATFMYDGEPRFALILNPSYRDPENGKYKLHAASLKMISRDLVLRYIIPNLNIANVPKVFYDTVYKPYLNDQKAYRTYLVEKIGSITMFDYDPANQSPAKDSGTTTVDEMQDYFTKNYGEFAAQYRQVDKTAMLELFKRGATMKDIESYYKGVVLKRFVGKYSDAQVMKKFFEEG
jgi:hypothetical protein